MKFSQKKNTDWNTTMTLEWETNNATSTPITLNDMDVSYITAPYGFSYHCTDNPSIWPKTTNESQYDGLLNLKSFQVRLGTRFDSSI